jgi:hypothetical protein
MNEQIVFQALMQFTQHNMYSRQLDPNTAVEEAKTLVQKMIDEAKIIVESTNQLSASNE